MKTIIATTRKLHSPSSDETAMKLCISSDELPSRFGLGKTVSVKLQGHELEGQIIGISFVAGKVMYTVAVYTGYVEPSVADQYGLVNSIGYDRNGREYLRIPNIDSCFVDELPVEFKAFDERAEEERMRSLMPVVDPALYETQRDDGVNCKCMSSVARTCTKPDCPRRKQ